MKKFLPLIALATLVGCVTPQNMKIIDGVQYVFDPATKNYVPVNGAGNGNTSGNTIPDSTVGGNNPYDEYVQPNPSGNAGQRILAIGDTMIKNGEIIQGDSNNYINALYYRAGYVKAKRQMVFQASAAEPFANPAMFKPGDWVFFNNLSYKNVPHSGVFVSWVNPTKKTAKILSYPGENRNEPGRYRDYDLSQVFAVIRPKD